MEVVEANGAIKTACGEQAHFIVDEDAGDLTIMVCQLFEDKPAILMLASTTAFSRLLLLALFLVVVLLCSSTSCILLGVNRALKFRVLPDDYLTAL